MDWERSGAGGTRGRFYPSRCARPLGGWTRCSEGRELGCYGGGLGCADSSEDCGCPAQLGSRGGEVCRGDGAAAQSGQRVRLVPGSADGTGQFQGLLVMRPRPGGLTPEPVQRPCLI
jgi:hypothetical protein